MNDPSKTLRQQNYQGTPSAISSQESEAGPLPCGTQDGKTADLCGQEVALANLSARQAKERGKLTSGTYGPHSSTSSASVRLVSCLVSRLKQQLPTDGSTLFKLTWREKDAPSGHSVYRLVASGHRTSGSGCGSWATPRNNDGVKRGDIASDPRNGLPSQCLMSPWATATSTQAGGTPEQFLERKVKSFGAKEPKLTDLQLCVVANQMESARPTPSKSDSKGSGPTTVRQDGVDRTFDRLDYATEQGVGQPTPKCQNARGRAPKSDDLHSISLTANGYPAKTVNNARLNPAHARWLMGYPEQWDSSSPLFEEWQEMQTKTNQGDFMVTEMP